MEEDITQNLPTAEEEDDNSPLRIPGFLNDEDIGLGDVVKELTSAVGIRPCGECERRAARLNRWLVLSGRRKH